MEQIVGLPVPQFAEEIFVVIEVSSNSVFSNVPPSTQLKRVVWDRDRALVVEDAKVIPQERTQQRTMEQIADPRRL